MFGALVGTYSGACCMSRKIRGKDDALNSSFGGLFAGVLIGIQSGSRNPVSIARTAVSLSVLTGAIDLGRRYGPFSQFWNK